ncbi:hypothetical protein C8Q80DRAFT_1270223 [Daedaleopsis nitida]|nr:hypothetical protein C8Q80DRAFT_1270223 [Daedaleopsis nitida]
MSDFTELLSDRLSELAMSSSPSRATSSPPRRRNVSLLTSPRSNLTNFYGQYLTERPCVTVTSPSGPSAATVNVDINLRVFQEWSYASSLMSDTSRDRSHPRYLLLLVPASMMTTIPSGFTTCCHSPLPWGYNFLCRQPCPLPVPAPYVHPVPIPVSPAPVPATVTSAVPDIAAPAVPAPGNPLALVGPATPGVTFLAPIVVTDAWSDYIRVNEKIDGNDSNYRDKWYLVIAGTRIGVFKNWKEASEYVIGIQGSRYKGHLSFPMAPKNAKKSSEAYPSFKVIPNTSRRPPRASSQSQPNPSPLPSVPKSSTVPLYSVCITDSGAVKKRRLDARHIEVSSGHASTSQTHDTTTSTPQPSSEPADMPLNPVFTELTHITFTQNRYKQFSHCMQLWRHIKSL